MDINKTSTLNFQRADFDLFRILIWKVLEKQPLETEAQEGWTLRNLEAVTGHPYVLKDELAGKKTSLSEPGSFAGTQVIPSLLEKEAGSSGSD